MVAVAGKVAGYAQVGCSAVKRLAEVLQLQSACAPVPKRTDYVSGTRDTTFELRAFYPVWTAWWIKEQQPPCKLSETYPKHVKSTLLRWMGGSTALYLLTWRTASHTELALSGIVAAQKCS